MQSLVISVFLTDKLMDVDENILLDRLEKDKSNRPLISSTDNLESDIQALLEIRTPFYNSARRG